MRRVGVIGALGALLRTLRRRAAIRRFAMAAGVLSAGTALGALALAAGSTAAWADGPVHVKSTFSFANPASAAAAHGRYATIDVPGATATNAISVNDFAVVVGGYTDTQGVSHGFIDRNGVFTTVNDPHAGTAPGQGTVVNGLNNRGIIVGLYIDSHGTMHGFELNNAR